MAIHTLKYSTSAEKKKARLSIKGVSCIFAIPEPFTSVAFKTIIQKKAIKTESSSDF
jgi:hypothetical protein